MASDDLTPFLITPKLGAVGPISLVGSALPVKGVTFGTEQRIKTRYYPGNPIATQTVIGPIKPNTTITGRWMDQSLGDGGTRTLILDMEYLCERAIPVEVRWGGRATEAFLNGEDPAIVRQGLIKKFEPKYNRTIDAEWSLEFEWSGDPIQSAPPTFQSNIQNGTDLTDFSDALLVNAEGVRSWMDTAWSYLSKGTNAMLVVSDALDNVLNVAVDAAHLVSGASDLLQQAAELPSGVVDRIRGTCDAVIGSCADARAAYDASCGLTQTMIQDIVSGQSTQDTVAFFSLQVKRGMLALNPTDDPLARLDGQTSIYTLLQGWDDTAERASAISATYAAKQVPEVIAVVRPPAGSDLRDLAAKYYDNPDLWIIIADYNGLDSSVVPATPIGPSEWGAPPIYVPRQTAENVGLVWSEP